MFKGFTNIRPRSYKTPKTWEVRKVLETIKSWGENKDMNRKNITYKVTMLLALASGSRCSELASLDTRYMKKVPDGIVLQLTRHKKNARCSEMPGQLFIGELKGEKKLCPCACLIDYINKTKNARNGTEDPILRAQNKKQGKVGTATVARWLTDCIRMAGTDVKTGKSIAHSTRGKATSEAKKNGMSTAEIMKAAGWKTDQIFERFYYTPEFTGEFSNKVLQNDPQVKGQV